MNSLEALDTKFWESKLGLLPIKLFHSKETVQQKFIMLNGVSNNFCLDIDPNNELSKKDYWNHAWSCDVGSFVRITNDKVHVYNWGKQDKVEKYDKKVVFERIDSFYKYLGEKQIPKENSIVPFATSIFRSLRNEFGEEGKAEISLKAFLYMLAFVENENPITNFNAWGLDGIDKNILNVLAPYIDQLKNGIDYYDLKPNMSLILRHASGKLFQEAHYLATLDRQRTIWGTVSSKIDIQPEKYGTVHFTPSFVARSIVEEVLDAFSDSEFPSNLKIFDPAMGSGEFLKEILRQLKNKGYSGKVSIVGWDISKPAIDMAKFVLAFEQKEWNDNITIDLTVVENSLTKNWGDNFDIVLMNPPFLSWELLKEDNDRQIIREVLGSNYEKNPNMASAFFWKAIQSLKSNGVLGSVMPTSILNADSYKMLRNNVEEVMTPRLIAKLGNYVFQNAFTDACFYVGQKNKQIHNTKIVWTHNIANAAAEALRASRKLRFSKTTIFSEENYSVYYSDVPYEDWTPHSLKGIKLKQNLERRLDSMQLKTIKQIFDVKQGARIGSSVFVIDGEFFNQLSSREKRFFRPVSQNKNILNGKLSIINYLFYPNSEGLETINNEDSLKAILPFFYEFKLLPNKTLLQNRARRTENNWWLLSEDRAWQRKKEPKLISTEFGKAGSFAFDKTGEFAVERGCAWIPKNEEKFSEHTYYAYLSIFCSDFFNDLLGIYSTQIAGGNWWHLSKKDTDEIPIPDLTQANKFQSEKFILLNGIGRKLSEGIEKIDTSLLNSLVRDIYEQY